MGVTEGEEEKMEERVEEEKCLEGEGGNSASSVRFLEDDRLLTTLLESTSESRSGRIRGSFGTVGGRRRRRRELVISNDEYCDDDMMMMVMIDLMHFNYHF